MIPPYSLGVDGRTLIWPQSSGACASAGGWDATSRTAVIGAWDCREPGCNAFCDDTLPERDISALIPDTDVPFAVYQRGYCKDGSLSTIVVFNPGEPFTKKVHLLEGECESVIVTQMYTSGTRVGILGMLHELWPMGGVQVVENGDLFALRCEN